MAWLFAKTLPKIDAVYLGRESVVVVGIHAPILPITAS
jgi:hypothetical protein